MNEDIKYSVKHPIKDEILENLTDEELKIIIWEWLLSDLNKEFDKELERKIYENRSSL